jgi:hypothetical protein
MGVYYKPVPVFRHVKYCKDSNYIFKFFTEYLFSVLKIAKHDDSINL